MKTFIQAVLAIAVVTAAANVASADFDPRGMFVLGTDGHVARIDPLEPQPDLVTDPDGDLVFFAAQALRP